MSVLSLVTSALITALEKELVNHEPDLQALAFEELSKAADVIKTWVDKKLNPDNNSMSES